MKKFVQQVQQKTRLEPKQKPGHGLTGAAVVERVKRMLAARQLKAAATRLDGAAKSFVACAEAWNSTQLRFGGHAAVTARETNPSPKQPVESAWDPQGGIC
jgi:hypothetical protein